MFILQIKNSLFYRGEMFCNIEFDVIYMINMRDFFFW